MIKICQIKYGEIIWWQRRWLEEEDLNRVCSWSLMEKKKFVYCLEEEGGFKESILLCTETSQ